MGTINANTRITIFLCLVALLVASAVGIFTSRCLVCPILRVIDAANALSQGHWEQRLHEPMVKELALLARAFNRTAEQLESFFTQLEYEANHDVLTGLFNRNAFRLKLREAIYKRDRNTGYSFAVLFLDLDYFKLINDSLGHLAGDELLVEFTKRLRACLQTKDVVSRFGGDEFVILLNNIADINDVIKITEQIIQTCQQPFDLNDDRIFISTSIGVVLSEASGELPEDFLSNGDIALYRAKSSGKAGYKVFDTQMHAEVVERLQLEMNLRLAIENEEFLIYYQPIVDTSNYALKGFEALLRWPQATENFIHPAKFIPIAEETGLILKLDLWVLRNACEQMQIWQQQFSLTQPLFVSVNLSGKQFLQPDFLEKIEQILLETGVGVNRLKLEITETVLMNYEETTRERLSFLRNLGINLTIDDFGTGYSSLSYLYQFPVNTLKFDRSFISCLGNNGENLEIVEAITALAHKLGMDVIAEGVETTAQLEQLYNIGCEQIQGYLFSRPLNVIQATELIASSLC